MPYWPLSSRVGAVPQQPTTKPKQQQQQGRKSDRFGRAKGITMEDLKKQTALRLAQEQNRQNHRSGLPTPPPSAHGSYSLSGGRASVSSSSSAPLKGTIPPAAVNSTRSNLPTTAPLPLRPQPLPTYREPLVEELPSSPYGVAAPLLSIPRDSRGEVSPQALERNSNLGQQRIAPPPHLTPPKPFVRNSPEYLMPLVLQPSLYPETASTNMNNSKTSQKSKLPHGLTVQELKEMTKARLQAEAAIKSGELGPTGSTGNTLSESPSTGSAALPTGGLLPSLRPVSPSPPGFSSLEGQTATWSASTPDPTENWETLSIGGVVPSSLARAPSSDAYLMIPSTDASILAPELNTNHPRHLVLSMHEEPRSLLDHGAPFSSEVSSSMAFSADSVEGAFSSDPDHSMFGSVQNPQSVHRERAFSSENVHSSAALQGALVTPIGAYATTSHSTGNRVRAFTTMSLPSTSHMVDELGMNLIGPAYPLGGGVNSAPTMIGPRFSSCFGAVREDSPLLTTAGLADVFRVSSFDRSPGAAIAPSTSSSMYPEDPEALSGSSVALPHADNRMRAATWSEPGSLFCSVGNNCEFDDFSSILKLSGAEDNNHFLNPSE